MGVRTVANPADLLTPVVCVEIDSRLGSLKARQFDEPREWAVVAEVVNYPDDGTSHLEVSAHCWVIDKDGDPIIDFGPAFVFPLWSAQVPAQPAGPVTFPAA